ncbi:hypothetical protein EXU48_14735 [Occultella glacieicola]|uniref:Uncharacterized protein n=1 Tax=Occultella glacieicola TaxID=2518684 RepID=A0ABY2E654_9MICO|nr:hypothetical protein [Occultella glacieicola]TDE92767.1 hypothetical protein EXU48_14735 [Occultella glacieicola]
MSRGQGPRVRTRPKPATEPPHDADQDAEFLNGVICIDIRMRDETDDERAAALTTVTEDVAAFFREYVPDLQVVCRSGSVTLTCAGSLAEVMAVADTVRWHLGCLARWEGATAFNAQVGVAVGAMDAIASELSSRAEAAAACPMWRRRIR